MASVLSEFLKSFPNNSVTIERFSEVTNDIGEKTKTWVAIYSSIKCIFVLTRQQGDNNEVAQKQKIKADFICRIELEDIGQSLGDASIVNVTEKDRVVIGGKVYEIEFVYGELGDVNLIDHCSLFLNLID